MIELASINWENILATYAIKKGLDATLKVVNTKISGKNKFKLNKNFQELTIESFKHQLNEVAIWSSQLDYTHSGKHYNLSKLYIELDLHLEPISKLEEESNKKTRLKTQLRKIENHLILLGRPGTGKTTTLKAICYDLIRGRSVLKDYFPVPIVIRFREIDNTASIFDILLKKLNFQFVNKSKENINLDKIDFDTKVLALDTFLDENKLVIIFDGFDEISNTTVDFLGEQMSCKLKFVNEFAHLSMNVKNSLFILSSRTADFNYLIQNTIAFEISKLSKKQISSFLAKFFDDETERKNAQQAILDKKLLGTEYIPLTLSYLCIIYKKYGRLFNSRRETYNKLLDLLLEEWDIGRRIDRKSNFFEFDTYDKKRFLRQLSFELSNRYDSSYFSTEEIRKVYDDVFEDFEGLTVKDFKLIFQELETHTGLLVRAGNGFIFSHKSVQEFLFATYLYEFPEIPNDKALLVRFPNELALATSFNENPSLYLSYLILNRFDDDYYEESFLFPFIDRIILEQPKFKVHPYLGLSFLYLYNNIKFVNNKFESDRMMKSKIKYFFTFLNLDKRIDKSLHKLGKYYEIRNEYGEKNLILLKKVLTIDDKAQYIEPEELRVSYDFYNYFKTGANRVASRQSK